MPLHYKLIPSLGIYAPFVHVLDCRPVYETRARETKHRNTLSVSHFHMHNI